MYVAQCTRLHTRRGVHEWEEDHREYGKLKLCTLDTSATLLDQMNIIRSKEHNQ